MENFDKAIKNIIRYKFASTDRETVNIGYGIDDNYARCMATSVVSFCINNLKYSFNVHLLAKNLSDVTKKSLKEMAQDYKLNIYIYEIDYELLMDKSLQNYLKMPTYFRFILPLVLKDIDKIYYIDSDIICLKDATNLFKVDLGNAIIAAVTDSETMNKKQNAILNLNNHIYFNAGMLVIDVKKWNDFKVLDKLIDVTKKDFKYFSYYDQDALNLILTKRIKYLSRIYNYIETNNTDSKEKVKNEDIIIMHFAALPKPWHIAWPISTIANEFNKNLYHHYEQKTPWKNMPLEEPKNIWQIRVYIKALLYNKAFIKAIPWIIRYFKIR